MRGSVIAALGCLMLCGCGGPAGALAPPGRSVEGETVQHWEEQPAREVDLVVVVDDARRSDAVDAVVPRLLEGLRGLADSRWVDLRVKVVSSTVPADCAGDAGRRCDGASDGYARWSDTCGEVATADGYGEALACLFERAPARCGAASPAAAALAAAGASGFHRRFAALGLVFVVGADDPDAEAVAPALMALAPRSAFAVVMAPAPAVHLRALATAIAPEPSVLELADARVDRVRDAVLASVSVRGDPRCLPLDVAPACVVTETLAGAARVLPACVTGAPPPCWRVEDGGGCERRLVVDRGGCLPPAGTELQIRCPLVSAPGP